MILDGQAAMPFLNWRNIAIILIEGILRTMA